MTREERLFSAIGGVSDALINEAVDPEGPERKRPSWGRWGALAAALVLVVGLCRFAPRMIGGGGEGTGANDSAAPGEVTFMAYAGPTLPLTVLKGPEGLPATRKVTWSFPPASEREGSSLYTVEVTDTTVITNDQGRDLTITIGYPVSASFRDEGTRLPILTMDGQTLKTTLLWGERPKREDDPVWSSRLESWQDYVALLEGDACLNAALEPPPALDQTVTVWEFLDETAPEDDRDIAPTLAVSFSIDLEQTQVYPWGFNGMELRDDGTVQYSFFVRQTGERAQRRLLIFVGEAPEEYTIGGYENGGCEKPMEGISAKVSTFPATLGEMLDQLAEGELPGWGNIGGITERMEDFKAALRRMMEPFLSKQPGEGGILMLEDLVGQAMEETRVVWSTAEVSIPAGKSVTVTARFQKEPSYDFACTNTKRRGIYGWDLAARLGSTLDIQEITACLENTQGLEVVRNDFGFDQKAGVLTVELSPEQEHCAMEVRVISGE